MNKEQFQQFAESYGSDLNRWPDAIRAEADQDLANQPTWQALLDREGGLDQHLDQYQINTDITALEARISKQAFEQMSLLDRIFAWISPDAALWRPALAASIPILIGFVLGSSLNFDEQYTIEEELELIQFEVSYPIDMNWSVSDET